METALTPDSLADVGVVAVEMWDQSDAELDAVATAWAWAAYEHPELDLVEHFPGNRLLAAAGVQWAGIEYYPARTSPAGYAAESLPNLLPHAIAALEAAEANAAGNRTLSRPEIGQAVATLE